MLASLAESFARHSAPIFDFDGELGWRQKQRLQLLWHGGEARYQLV